MPNIWRALSPEGRRRLLFMSNTGQAVEMKCGTWVACNERECDVDEHLKNCDPCAVLRARDARREFE